MKEKLVFSNSILPNMQCYTYLIEIDFPMEQRAKEVYLLSLSYIA
jgi:hypothetical protein